jgi:type II secretory pathway component GspD/PulD (secretin)
MTDKEAMAMALEALKQTLQTLDDENAKPGGAIADTIWHSEHETLFDYLGSEITALKEALAQPEQEPVGQLLEDAFGRGQVMWFNKPKDESMLYTTTPQRIEEKNT